MPSSVEIKSKRPLSPHLQVYKLPLTALMSISHRVTGIALIFGTFIVAGFFIAAASGEQYYNIMLDYAETIYGRVILIAWSAALFYHMCNGIRHMVWDTGHLLSKKASMTANYVVIISAVLITFITWQLACGCWKGWF